MKRNLTLLSFIFVLCSSKFIAQTYNALNLTGFNTDVIADTRPAAGSTSSNAIDVNGYVLYSAAYAGTLVAGGGLNIARTYTTSLRTYSLSAYNANNALRVDFNAKDSLKLVTPGNYSVISLLAFSSGIDASTDITVRFTDGTSATYNSQVIYNWTSTHPAVAAGFGKTNRTTDAIYVTLTEPKFYAIDLPIACANQSKMVSKIVVKNNSNGSSAFVFAISAVSLPNYVANSTPAVCKGSSTGTAKAFGVDMFGPVSYTWSSSPVQNTQTATGLPAGDYTVSIVDANGCAFSKTVTVSEPATSFSITSVLSASVACVTASNTASSPIGINVTGGSTPYTFIWTNIGATTGTITGAGPGVYTVTAKDANGCTLSANPTVTTPVVAITVSTSSLLCGATPNATATVGSITGSGGGPYTYTWSTTPVQTTTVATAINSGTYSVKVADQNGCVNTQTFSILAPDLNLTTTGTTCTLSTGSATVSAVTGGSGGPYTYTWSPAGGNAAVASNLAAGNYTVTVKDAASCSITKTLSIAAINPTLAVTATSVSCGNLSTGTASVNITGGAGGPYTYTWSPAAGNASTASNLGAGNYTVTVKGISGCVATSTFAIMKPSLTIATSSTSCGSLQPTGSATVTSVNGGVGPYMYSWDGTSSSSTPSVMGLDQNTYSVSVTDANNCIITANYDVSGPSTGSLTAIVTTSATTCSGINNGKAMVTSISGGLTPYAYNWNSNPPQYTPLATGLASPHTYICTIIDYNNCIINRAAVINPAPLNINIYANPSFTICPTHTVMLSVAGAASYTWSTGGSTASITVTPPGTTSSSATTVYSFTGTTTGSCVVTGSTSVMTSSTVCILGVEEQQGNVSYNLYPNPNNGQFVLVLDAVQDNATLEVMDALGKVALTQNIIGTQTTVNTATLQDGIYFVTVKNKDRIIIRTKIIKQ